jgi:hypothetical protein
MQGFCHEDRKRQRKNWQIRRPLKNTRQQFAIALSDPVWPHDQQVNKGHISSETEDYFHLMIDNCIHFSYTSKSVSSRAKRTR